MADAKIKKIIGRVSKLNFFTHLSQICHFNLENCLQMLFIYTILVK